MIDDLLKELCPDGVDYVKIQEVCVRQKGMNITAQRMCELDNPNGQIKIFAAGSTVAMFNEADVPSQCIIRNPSIIVKSRGNIGFEYCIVPFSHKNEMWSYSAIDNKIDLKYLFHLLLSKTDLFQFIARSNAVKLPQLCVKDTDCYEIPLPPLPIQQHIVEVLDTFTDAISNLEEELALREKQCEYYREQLLSFDDQNVKWSSIKDCISSLSTGVNPRQHFVLNSEGSSYNYITGKNISNNKIDISSGADKVNAQALSLINKRAKLANDMLLFASTGTGTVGRMAYVEHYDNSWTVSETLYVIKAKQLVNTKFLMHVLNAWHIKKQYIGKISKGSVPHLKMSDLLNVFIPVPSLERQQEIVEILDTFEAMIANIREEIVLRTKQYEYYREKLLSFGN